LKGPHIIYKNIKKSIAQRDAWAPCWVQRTDERE